MEPLTCVFLLAVLIGVGMLFGNKPGYSKRVDEAVTKGKLSEALLLLADAPKEEDRKAGVKVVEASLAPLQRAVGKTSITGQMLDLALQLRALRTSGADSARLGVVLAAEFVQASEEACTNLNSLADRLLSVARQGVVTASIVDSIRRELADLDRLNAGVMRAREALAQLTIDSGDRRRVDEASRALRALVEASNDVRFLDL